MKKCDKPKCIANLDGECVVDECQGMIFMYQATKTKDREKRKVFYEVVRETFREDFESTKEDNYE